MEQEITESAVRDVSSTRANVFLFQQHLLQLKCSQSTIVSLLSDLAYLSRGLSLLIVIRADSVAC